jgi:hypothetical protein
MLSVLANNYDVLTIKTVDYVLKCIDYKKLARRAAYAKEHVDLEVKCSLMEYAYTTLSNVKKGCPNIVSYVPGTGVMTNAAINSKPVLDLLTKILGGEDYRVHIYTRVKIDHSKSQPHTHMRELILMFDRDVVETYNDDDHVRCYCQEDD